MSRNDLIGIVMEEATDNGVYIGTLTAEDIADAIIAAGYKKEMHRMTRQQCKCEICTTEPPEETPIRADKME